MLRPSHIAEAGPPLIRHEKHHHRADRRGARLGLGTALAALVMASGTSPSHPSSR